MNQSPDAISLIVGITALALLPFAAVVMTSYTKIVVVLGLLRNAVGVQQVPPNIVLNGIALIVSCFIMAPVAIQAVDIAKSQPVTGQSSAIVDLLEASRAPFQAFLGKHTPERERQFFLRSARELWPAAQASELHSDDLIILAPSFALTELTAAFRIGFLLYLTFAVIDLIVANVLMALGLSQVSPTNLAIPFKLLLFIVLDGWSILIHNLVLTYR